MKNKTNQNLHLSENLMALRNHHGYSLEQLAEKVGVTRQAISKWENGTSLPDILNCGLLAELYDVSIDALLYHDTSATGIPIAPKGKHYFGVVTIGERGQLVLPKKARELLAVKKGDTVVVLGDENQETFGLALVPSERFMGIANKIMESMHIEERKPNDECKNSTLN